MRIPQKELHEIPKKVKMKDRSFSSKDSIIKSIQEIESNFFKIAKPFFWIKSKSKGFWKRDTSLEFEINFSIAYNKGTFVVISPIEIIKFVELSCVKGGSIKFE